MKTLFVRIAPQAGPEKFFSCGIEFSRAWKAVNDLDNATVARLKIEQMLETSETQPAGYTPAETPVSGGDTSVVNGEGVLSVAGSFANKSFGQTFSKEARYQGQHLADLQSVSGWVQLVTGGATVLPTVMSDGVAGLAFNLPAGSSSAFLDKAISIPYTADTTLGLMVEFPDAGRVAGLQIVAATDSTLTNWSYAGLGGSSGAIFNGGVYFIPTAVGAMTLGGGTGLPAEGTIGFIRLRVLSTYKNQGGVVKFRWLKANSMARPKMIIGFDDGYLSQHTEGYRYMSKYGLLGTIGVVSNLIGANNYMSVAQLREMYDAGWDMVGHTQGHAAWCDNSKNSICLAQTPVAGPLALNGAVGATVFDTPRHVVVRANDQGLKLTITGKDAAGVSIQEDMYTWTGSYYLPTLQVFSQVTSIVVDQAAAASMQIGTCRSEAQMRADLVVVRDFLVNNGMPRGANHFVFPQGEYNATGLALLDSLGFVSARIVSGQHQQPHVGDYRKYQLPGYGGGGASLTAAVLNAIRQKAIDVGGVTSTYLHDVTPVASDSAKTARAEFRAFVDATAADVAAGKIDCITQSMVRTS